MVPFAMGDSAFLLESSLASAIRKVTCPKKIKFLLWELLYEAFDTKDLLQRHMPFLEISPGWCTLCKLDGESQNFIFNHVSFLGILGAECIKLLGGLLFFLWTLRVS